MEHDYQLDWRDWSAVLDPTEVCVTPGHGLHTRGDAIEADRYPHLFTLHVEAMTIRVRPLGQMALSL